MNAIRFTTVDDLRNWANAAMRPDATSLQVTAVIHWILRDGSRPAWGMDDWSEYLDRLDLCDILNRMY